MKLPFNQAQNSLEEEIDFPLSDHEKILLIKYLIDPKVPNSGQNKRARHRPTEIKILNCLYQLNKNLHRNDWTSFSPGKKRIGKSARTVGRKAVTRFICGRGLVFIKKTPRYKKTNIYELNPWVVEAFRFFEVKGMMKDFLKDYEGWRKTFLRRLDRWLLPLLENGHTLRGVLMNKLSTEKPLKGADPETLKGAGIKLYRGEIKPSGIKSRQEPSQFPAVRELETLSEELKTRFDLKESDINRLIKFHTLSDLKGAYRIRSEYGQSYNPKSPIKVFMSCLKKHKASKPRVDIPAYLEGFKGSYEEKLKLAILPETVFKETRNQILKKIENGFIPENPARYFVDEALIIAEGSGYKIPWDRYYATLERRPSL